MRLPLDVLEPKPDFSTRALLIVDALSPLSMVAKMPGKYYRSQPEPTDIMLLGLLENALGWHIAGDKRGQQRYRLLQKLAQKHGTMAEKSGVDYGSLLQWHVRFAVKHIPALMHYDDLWTQHLKHRDDRHVNGSRNHDFRAIGLLNEAEASGEKIDPSSVIHFFPQYYASPTPREYVVPDGPYKYAVETSPQLARLLQEALDDPAAPLYLGSNDGWVEVKWEVMA